MGLKCKADECTNELKSVDEIANGGWCWLCGPGSLKWQMQHGNSPIRQTSSSVGAGQCPDCGAKTIDAHNPYCPYKGMKMAGMESPSEKAIVVNIGQAEQEEAKALEALKSAVIYSGTVPGGNNSDKCPTCGQKLNQNGQLLSDDNVVILEEVKEV